MVNPANTSSIQIAAGNWFAAVELSLMLMALAGCISAVGGIAAGESALAMQRAGRRWMTGWWTRLMLVAACLPLILHAAGWEATAGKFGWLTQTVTGGNLGWVGWIHGCHGVSLVALATWWAGNRIDPAIVRQGRLQHGALGLWWHVRWPLMRSTIAAAVMFVMLLAATEMSVVNLHSVRTVADQFYLFHVADPSGTSMVVTIMVPWLLGVPLMIWRWRLRPIGATAEHAMWRETMADDGDEHRFSWLAHAGFYASVLLVFGLPMSGLLAKAGHVVSVIDGQRQIGWSIGQAMSSVGEAPRMFASEYGWTLQLAILTSVIGVPLAWVAATWADSSGRKHAGRVSVGAVIDLVAIALFLIPGPVIGLLCSRLFAGSNELLTMLATRTLVPTMLAVGVRGGIVAYFVLRVGRSMIDPRAIQAARLDGSAWSRLYQVEIPLMWPYLVVATTACGIVASGDVPAMLPVVPPGVTTVGTRLFSLLHSGARYQEASLAFWYLAAVLVVAKVASRLLRQPVAPDQDKGTA